MKVAKTQVFTSTCPHCGRVNQLATGKATVHDGAFSLCIGCGNSGVFEASAPGGLRMPTAEEAELLAAHPQIQHWRRVWRAAKGRA